jgi:hypothetical protein
MHQAPSTVLLGELSCDITKGYLYVWPTATTFLEESVLFRGKKTNAEKLAEWFAHELVKEGDRPVKGQRRRGPGRRQAQATPAVGAGGWRRRTRAEPRQPNAREHHVRL